MFQSFFVEARTRSVLSIHPPPPHTLPTYLRYRLHARAFSHPQPAHSTAEGTTVVTTAATAAAAAAVAAAAVPYQQA